LPEKTMMGPWHCGTDVRSTESILDFALNEVELFIGTTKVFAEGMELSQQYEIFRETDVDDEKFWELDEEVKDYLTYDLPQACSEFMPDDGEFGFDGDAATYGMKIIEQGN
jgi:hypothetical protein